MDLLCADAGAGNADGGWLLAGHLADTPLSVTVVTVAQSLGACRRSDSRRGREGRCRRDR